MEYNKATCADCGAVIRKIDGKWKHMGTQYPHEPEPLEGTYKVKTKKKREKRRKSAEVNNDTDT